LSQHYSEWEKSTRRQAPTFVNPTQQLDWARFNSDSWIACFEEQKNIIVN
jgi:beta-galactosidase